jgi:hypothetical protein
LQTPLVIEAQTAIAIRQVASGDSKKGLAITNQPFDTRAMKIFCGLYDFIYRF